MLAGCATTSVPPVAAPRPVAVAVVPPSLRRVVGQSPDTATALLGVPTLDKHEGPARALQWSRPACVLDLFYYPVAGGVRATQAAARLPDGRDIDPAACLALQLQARER